VALLVEQVLAVWRDGERLLDALPEVHPDHETVAMSVAELRALYAQMTGLSALSRNKFETSRRALERSRATLEAVRQRLDRLDRPDP
jgi:hypothetical protein